MIAACGSAGTGESAIGRIGTNTGTGTKKALIGAHAGASAACCGSSSGALTAVSSMSLKRFMACSKSSAGSMAPSFL
eukprot:CAMPEP_0181485774 /NCGR_PEP_ID=MMETSP1110-20121109/46757_1 /TAXON_ID=174948 /ORGANISM="Symbiodinium sp., Strain CCMP421" /LENGTH=76 /DNA_ID=CAMNT_0023611821 /DNA_START=506 /DNA_END=736 /DNA_ORIENTATION=+